MILILFVGIIMALIIKIAYKSFYNEAFSSHECWSQIKTKELEFDGLVKNKFVDSNNHNINAIEIDSKGQFGFVHFPYPEESDLWDKIKVNDSIKKSENNLNFLIKDSLKWDTIIVKYNCK
jgi:hypothetical protein